MGKCKECGGGGAFYVGKIRSRNTPLCRECYARHLNTAVEAWCFKHWQQGKADGIVSENVEPTYFAWYAQECAFKGLETYVYFIQDTQRKLIKVGYTNKLERRLTEIGRDVRSELLVLFYIRGDRFLEKRLHHYLRHYRDKHEWFQPTLKLEAVMEALKPYAVEREGHEAKAQN